MQADLKKKVTALAVILAELLFCGVYLAGLRGGQVLTWGQEELLVSADSMGAEEEDAANTPGFYVDNSYGTALVTPDFYAKRGVYTITVDYSGNAPAEPKQSISRVVVADDAWEAEGARLADSERGVLSGGGVLSYRADLREGSFYRVVNTIDPAVDGQYLLINSITLTRMVGKTICRDALMLLAFFLVIDLALFGLFFRREQMRAWNREHGTVLAILAAIVAFGCFPLVSRGIYFGDDIFYHLRRMAFLAEGIKSGAFPVKIQPGWSNGYGYAAGVGYGDVFLLPSALLYLAGFPLSFGYESYIVLMTVLTAWIAYRAFREMGGSTVAGLTASAVYTLTGFRLHSIYAGATVGEYGAYTFLPLIVWGLWGIYLGREEGRRRYEDILAAGVGLILSCHVLTTLMTAFAIVLFALIWIGRTLKKEVLFKLLRALGKSVLLTLWFTVPLLHYMLTDSFRGDVHAKLLWKHAYDPEELFILLHDPSAISGGFLGVGIAAFVILGVSFARFLSGREGSALARSGFRRVFGLTVLFLWMSCSLFPWHYICAHLPWLYAPLSNLQFSWHFLDPAAVLLALLAAIAVGNFGRIPSGDKSFPAGAALLLSGILIALTLAQSGDYLGQVVREGRSIRQMGEGGLGTPINVEFSLKGSEAAIAGRTEPEAPDGVTVQLLSERGLSLDAQVENPTGDTAAVLFPRWAYRGYAATGERGRLALTEAEDHRVQVEIPAGYSGRVRVSYHEPWFWRVAEFISLVCWILLLWPSLIQRARALWSR